MARQIIVLERSQPVNGSFNVTAVFWLPVANGQEAPRPGFVSAVRGVDQPNATEIAALQDGSIFELITNWQLPTSYTLAQARSFLEVSYAAAAAAFNPPGQFYGMNWNGTAWVA